MKRKVRDIITIILFCSTLFANAQITKSEADAIVLNTIVNDTTKVVYAMSESISSNISVYTANGEEIFNPYEISYVYFIDDIPAANWEHPCRYCFINEKNGSYTMMNKTIYPDNYHAFASIGKQYVENRWQWPYSNYTIPPKAMPNSKLYAVLIAGDVGLYGSDQKAWYNLSLNGSVGRWR